MGVDWTALEKVGIAGICLAVIIFGFRVFSIVIEQWGKSTDAVDKNTKAFEKLADVFEKQAERELEFQERMHALLKHNVATAEETARDVKDAKRVLDELQKDLHKRFV